MENLAKDPICSQHMTQMHCLKDLERRLEAFQDTLEGVNTSVARVSDMFAELMVSKNDRNQLHKDIERLTYVVEDLRTSSATILTNMALDKAEHEGMKRDITSAHDAIRNLSKSFDDEKDELAQFMQDSNLFKNDLKTYMKVFVGVAALLPFAYPIFMWIAQLVNHIPPGAGK